MSTETTTCIRRPHSVWTTCPCADCTVDRNRMTKLHRNGHYRRIPSAAAAEVVRHLREDLGWTAHAIGSATGLHFRSVDRAFDRGTNIGPKVAAKIVNHGDPTAGSVGAVGTRRRLQGLAHQGYDLQTIADATGIGFTTLAAIRQGKTERVKSAFFTTVRDYTRDVGMQVGPSRPARLHAERNRWASLLAWDDDAIDDPKARHQGTFGRDARKGCDEAVVVRVLAGEMLTTTRLEKDEIVRRWVAAGNSRRSITERMGWKDDRYGKVDAA